MTDTTRHAPVVRSAHVERTPDDAFRIFTEEIGAWWPLPSHGVFGSESGGLAFVDEQLIEMSITGEQAVWGAIHTWEPPNRLVFSWHPGQASGPSSEVEVEFIADGSGTRVVLEHRGWEAFGAEAAARRARYTGPSAWGFVLDHFADGTEGALDAADLVALTAAADAFFDLAARGGFGSPDDGEWTAEEVIAHVTLNDAAMLAVCQGIVHGNDVRFDNRAGQDSAVLAGWIARHDGRDALVASGRRASAQVTAALSRLSTAQRATEVACHLVDHGDVMLDGVRPWSAIAIDIQAGVHLPAHTAQLADLRR